MGIQCRIIRNKEGKVSYVEAPNGSRSQLYEDAKVQYGEQAALDIVLTAYTPSFIENVKNPTIMNNRRELVKKIGNLPPRVNSITVNIDNGQYSFNPSEIEMKEENLGNGETLYSFEAPLTENKSAKTQGFFSDVVTGKSDKFKPRKEWTPLLDFTSKESKFKKVFDKFMGNFDTHIATSIPTFRETQIKVGAALTNMFKGTNALIYDIGGSEGGFVKSITEASGNTISTINLDANPDMKKVHNAKPVKGSKFIGEAFYEGFDDIKKHTPSQRADVVHESMTFQFITKERTQFIKEIRDNYLKEDGLVLLEEKLIPESQEEFLANENKKDEDYKSIYYTQQALSTKRDEVLTGMVKNQTAKEELLKDLKNNFQYVGEYWNSGNFKGYYATNSQDKANKFMDELGGRIESEFSSDNIRFQKDSTHKSSKELLSDIVDKLKKTGLAQDVQILSEDKFLEKMNQLEINDGFMEIPNGFVMNDIIYLNQDKASIDTPIHEFGHLWNSFMRQNAPDVYARGINLIKEQGKEYIDFVNQSQPELEGEDLYEEALAQAIGDSGARLVEESAKKSFKDWLTSLWDLLKKMTGISKPEAQKNLANYSLGEFTEAIAVDLLLGNKVYSQPVNPITPYNIQEAPKVEVKEDHNLSFVQKEDIVNMEDLINRINEEGATVGFWVADQLGRGMYYDEVNNGEHYLDAGISYALDPVNRDENIIWASGMAKKDLKGFVGESDYLFMISGSPQASKRFNKKMIDVLEERVGDFSTFKRELLETAPPKSMVKIIEKLPDTFKELRDSAKRKDFLNSIEEQRGKSTDAAKYIEERNAFLDYDSMRDGFLKDNGFDLNDIVLVLKPTGVGGKANHSTYETNILGEVVGVPDRKINAFDILSPELKKLYRFGKKGRAQQQQVNAPYGRGTRDIEIKTKFSIGDNLTESKFTSMLMRGRWGMMNAQNPQNTTLSEEENKQLNEEAQAWIENRGYETIDITGNYGSNVEDSFYVPDLELQDALDFAIKFNQESVATDKGLVYQDGTIEPRVNREDEFGGQFDNNYSSKEFGNKRFDFSIGYDSNTRQEADLKVKTVSQIDEESKEQRGSMPQLVRDEEGNYIFYHYSNQELNLIDPTQAGTNPKNITSQQEVNAIKDVGGVSMFYIRTENKEAGTGNYGHMVKVPMEKVYDGNRDALNLVVQARNEFKEKNPDKAFNPNLQAAHITKLAVEQGYQMAVFQWGATYRAQTTEALIPDEKEIIEGNTVVQSFTNYETRVKPKFSVGFMQTKKTAQGEQVKLTNTDSKIRGNGVATEMYKKVASKLMKKGEKLFSDFNNKGTVGIWDRLSRQGITESTTLNGKPVMATSDNSFDPNGEPFVEDVIRHIQSRNSEGMVLEPEEITQVRNIMMGTELKDSSELYKKLERAFLTEGAYNPSEGKLTSTGLYSRAEARRLLDNEERQIKAYEFLQKLRNSDVIENDVYIDNTYLTLIPSFNTLGIMKKGNPFLNEKKAVEKLGGITDKTIFDNQAEAYNLEFANFDELSQMRRLNVGKIYLGRFTVKDKQDTLREQMEETLTEPSDKTVIESANYLLDVPNSVWNSSFENVRELLNEFEKEAIDIGLDLTDLTEVAYDKTPTEVKNLINAVRNFAVNQNNATFDILMSNYIDFFNKPDLTELKVMNISAKNKDKTLFYLEGKYNSAELFDKHGLLPLGNNLYQKVNTGRSLDEVYNILYETIKVNPQILPKTAFKSAYDGNMLDRSFLNKPENRVYVMEDIEAFVNQETKKLEGKELDKDTLRKMVVHSLYFNTKLENTLTRPSIEDEVHTMNNYPSNSQYLKTEFISDFNKTMLREKQKNSEKYNNFYSNFSISTEGIELLNSDPITLENIKPYLTEDLKNHFKLKKNSFLFEEQEDIAGDIESDVMRRNYVSNYPDSVEKFTDVYQIEEDTLSTKEIKDFVRVDEGLFEYVKTVGNKSLYGRIQMNESNFKNYDPRMEAPSVLDSTKYSSNSGTKADKQVNQLYNGEQYGDLTNEIDNC